MTTIEGSLTTELRPVLQRSELGPIINRMALDIIDATDEVWSAEALKDELTLGPRLTLDALHSLSYFVTDPLQINSEHYVQSLNPDIVDHVEELMKTTTGNGVMQLTFYSNLLLLLHEGLGSGIAMPLHAYAGLELQKHNRGLYGPLDDVPLDPLHFVATMRSKKFQALLLMSANTRNGFYLSPATHFSATETNNPFAHLGEGPFVTEVPRLSTEAQETLHAQLASTRSPEAPSQPSDGCPVRRSHYDKLGTAALRYAELTDTPVAELRSQPMSAITRSCLYLAHSMEKLNNLR